MPVPKVEPAVAAIEAAAAAAFGSVLLLGQEPAAADVVVVTLGAPGIPTPAASHGLGRGVDMLSVS